MNQYNSELTHAWFAYRFYLSEVDRYSRAAERYRQHPARDILANAAKYAELARYRAAKWLARFIRLVKQAGGFVFVEERFVYVEVAI